MSDTVLFESPILLDPTVPLIQTTRFRSRPKYEYLVRRRRRLLANGLEQVEKAVVIGAGRRRRSRLRRALPRLQRHAL